MLKNFFYFLLKLLYTLQSNFNNTIKGILNFNFAQQATPITSTDTNWTYKSNVYSSYKLKNLWHSKLIKNNNTALQNFTHNLSQLYLYIYRTLLFEKLQFILTRFLGVGFIYIFYSCFIMYIDACLTDDEPLWEPIEWSLVQTWILFLFTFAWIAENLIVSRYGSYTGRDKRVWFAWYKTFWLTELYYIINFGAAVVLVIVPYYYETNYNISFLFSWWHWYSRVFFFQVYFVIFMNFNVGNYFTNECTLVILKKKSTNYYIY